MKNKSFAVIGLGQFGMTLAVTLAESDCDVLAIDDKEENIEEISEKVTYAVKADVREPGILKALGVQNVDVAIIAVAENLEASISATMQAKDLGVPFVVAKSMNSLHGRILDKIGADKIIYPEQSMGLRVARNLMSGGYLDVFELSAEFSKQLFFQICPDHPSRFFLFLDHIFQEICRTGIIGILFFLELFDVLTDFTN